MFFCLKTNKTNKTNIFRGVLKKAEKTLCHFRDNCYLCRRM